MAEQTLKKSEFLGILGLLGTVISSAQVLIFERQAVHELFYSSSCSKGVTTGVMIGLVTAFYAFYVGIGRFFIISKAALLNLSLYLLQTRGQWFLRSLKSTSCSLRR